MEEKAIGISERLEALGADTIMLCRGMCRNHVDRHIALQLVRCATSAGANYEEGRVAESKRDFIHKLHISLKECKETVFWLRIVKRAGILSEEKVCGILESAETLSRILAKSIITAKKSLKEN